MGLVPPLLHVPVSVGVVFFNPHPHPPPSPPQAKVPSTLVSPLKQRFPNLVVFGVNPPPPPPPFSSGNNSSRENVLFDEDGDMEGYLNHLSLEYDSVWDTKPSWCQPWTITLTGVSIVAISWLILHSVVVTSLTSLLIGAWWYIFLYSYPKAYLEMIAERREKVTNGVEDTFGRRNKQ
ncbi:hypothetical protein RIF29_37782 [Crotalaria pallida]|uniref:DUF6737 domain-containing protein n=1 Tax=Crotalaria pallida TaxID=3830 RepID=A0AAN9HKY0_CROPI